MQSLAVLVNRSSSLLVKPIVSSSILARKTIHTTKMVQIKVSEFALCVCGVCSVFCTITKNPPHAPLSRTMCV